MSRWQTSDSLAWSASRHRRCLRAAAARKPEAQASSHRCPAPAERIRAERENVRGGPSRATDVTRSTERDGPPRGSAAQERLPAADTYSEMHRLLPLLLMPMALAAAPPTAAARHTPTQTKTQAEVNVLRALARNSHRWRMPGLVNARTHLLTDNTEAVCHGLGGRRAGNSYARFVCVVRPHVHRGRQGLYVSYRALPKNRFELRFLAYRRR